MTTMDDLAEIKRLMMQTGITKLTLNSPTLSLDIVTADHAADSSQGLGADSAHAAMASVPPEPASPPAPTQPAPHIVRSSHIGRFQQRYLTRKLPAVVPGTHVVRGEILGFVQDGMTLHPVAADRDGTITETLQSQDAVVGYGAALFAYRP